MATLFKPTKYWQQLCKSRRNHELNQQLRWKLDHSRYCPKVSLDLDVLVDQPWPEHLHLLLQVFIFPTPWLRLPRLSVIRFQTRLIFCSRLVSAELSSYTFLLFGAKVIPSITLLRTKTKQSFNCNFLAGSLVKEWCSLSCAAAVRHICHWQDYLRENICQNSGWECW